MGLGSYSYSDRFPLSLASSTILPLLPMAEGVKERLYSDVFITVTHSDGPSTPQPRSEGVVIAQLSYGARFHRRQYPYGRAGFKPDGVDVTHSILLDTYIHKHMHTPRHTHTCIHLDTYTCILKDTHTH